MPERFKRTSEATAPPPMHPIGDPAKQQTWKVCVQPVEWREVTFEQLMGLTRSERPEDHGS